MKNMLFIILLSLYTANVFAGAGGYIGTSDNRHYGSLSDNEYNGIVKLSLGKGTCTGGFISKNLILTNSHCALGCKNGCSAEFWNGYGYEKSDLHIVAYYTEYETLGGNDWAILLSDKESPFYKNISPSSTPGQIIRGGFGTLRIIEDNEIPFLKNLYAKTMNEFYTECKNTKNTKFIECINRHVDKKLQAIGKKPLLGDTKNFKVQTCKILGSHPKSNTMLQTDCDSSGGDSGAPLLRVNQIVGLNNSGMQNIFGETDANANALKTENFYSYAQKYIKKYENTATSNPTNNNTNNNQTPNQQPTITNNNPEKPVSQPKVYDDQQTIQQMLQQKIQNFDCD